jgi:hypothetical protein
MRKVLHQEHQETEGILLQDLRNESNIGIVGPQKKSAYPHDPSPEGAGENRRVAETSPCGALEEMGIN